MPPLGRDSGRELTGEALTEQRRVGTSSRVSSGRASLTRTLRRRGNDHALFCSMLSTDVYEPTDEWLTQYRQHDALVSPAGKAPPRAIAGGGDVRLELSARRGSLLRSCFPGRARQGWIR
jgi:hypothetical protein